ncbi:beta-crystallin A1-like [Rhincodon typus]|uniref:beta-crystallin A1-like n=1 Tax=Rhincodon typus TaxID=259920 RepID=UPI00202DE8BE|nr:beta-crystallin A1-like [Rhincodon typus]
MTAQSRGLLAVVGPETGSPSCGVTVGPTWDPASAAHQRGELVTKRPVTPTSVVQIVVWERENFQGRRQEFTSECSNITQYDFDDVRSIRVESGVWVGYEHHDFEGQQFILERGEYSRWEAWSWSNSYHVEWMMSFRPVYCADHSASCMEIYERENFMGLHADLCEDYPSLQAMGWSNCNVGSMFVKRGAWVCYQFLGYRGYQYIMEYDRHSGEFKHWRQWGSHSQTPQIQSIRRIMH